MVTWWTTCTGTSTPFCSTTWTRAKMTAVSSQEGVLPSARGKGENYQKVVKIVPFKVDVNQELCVNRVASSLPSSVSSAMCLLEARATEDTWTWVKTSLQFTFPCRSRRTPSSMQTSNRLHTSRPTSRTSTKSKVLCIYKGSNSFDCVESVHNCKEFSPVNTEKQVMMRGTWRTLMICSSFTIEDHPENLRK